MQFLMDVTPLDVNSAWIGVDVTVAVGTKEEVTQA